MEHETFWSLMRSGPHWLFELFLMFLFDVVIGLVLWPCFKRYALHHQSDDKKTEKLEGQVAQQALQIAKLHKHLGLPEEENHDRIGKH